MCDVRPAAADFESAKATLKPLQTLVIDGVHPYGSSARGRSARREMEGRGGRCRSLDHGAFYGRRLSGASEERDMFDIRKFDHFGMNILFGDDDGKGGIDRFLALGYPEDGFVGMEHRLNLTMIFDRKGGVPQAGGETTNVGVFAL